MYVHKPNPFNFDNYEAINNLEDGNYYTSTNKCTFNQDCAILFWGTNYSLANEKGDRGYRHITGMNSISLRGYQYLPNVEPINNGDEIFNASSIQVSKGSSVRLYQNENLQGMSICINTDVPDLSQINFPGTNTPVKNNILVAQSFPYNPVCKFASANSVAVFKNPNFDFGNFGEGHGYVLAPVQWGPDFALPTIFEASSIMIPPGYYVIMHEREGNGVAIRFNSDRLFSSKLDWFFGLQWPPFTPINNRVGAITIKQFPENGYCSDTVTENCLANDPPNPPKIDTTIGRISQVSSNDLAPTL
jgi:hypothetical protein